MRPAALSISQATEFGTVYRVDEIEALCHVAKDFGLRVHMDGARFANALASLGVSPAAMTWRAGIDLLSFGATKNGAMLAEALLVFDEDLAHELGRRRKRAGHLLSKMRYVSAQLLAYVEDGLWLELAAHANRQAAAFVTAVEQHPQARLEFPAEANEVFVRWSAEGFESIAAHGIEFHVWPGHDDLARFVFAHSTTDEDTKTLIRALHG